MFQLGAISPSKLVGQLPYWDMPNVKDLDLFFDATRAGYKNKPTWGNALSSVLTDTHPQAIFVPTSSGLLSRAADTLSIGSLGLQTTPTYAQALANVSTMVGGGWTNGANATTSPFTAPDGTPAIRLTDNSTGYQSNTFTVALGADTITRYVSIYVRKTVGVAPVFAINLSTAGPGTGLSTLTMRVDTTTGQKTSGNFMLESYDANWWRIGMTFTNNNSGYTGLIVNYYPAARTTIGGNDDPTAQGFADVWMPNVTTGPAGFMPPTYITGTVTGNRQLITGLSSLLTTGFAGYIKLNALDVAYGMMLAFNDGTNANRVRFQFASGGRPFVTIGNVDTPGPTGPNLAIGPITYVFSCSANFLAVRAVGGSQRTDLSIGYPSGMNQIAIGGRGINNDVNAYQLTQKFGLKFGSQDQASFDAMYAMALSA